MKILSIISNQLYKKQNVYQKDKGDIEVQTKSIQPLKYDMICFTASRASGEPLRKLAEYGIPDMYTGQPMLTWKQLSRMLENGVFEFSLKRLIPILKRYEGTMLEVPHKVYKIFEKAEKNYPEETIIDVLKHQFPKRQKELLSTQQPVFERLIEKSCDLPQQKHKDFMDLMQMTSKKIAKDPVITHFSENEFIYKLMLVRKEIRSKNNKNEIQAINNLIKEAKSMFSIQAEEKKKFGHGFNATKAKMEYQMQPHILKKNTQNIQRLRTIFENSVLKNNKSISNILKNTSAKICGIPVVEPFKRKEFIYDLKNLLKDLKNKKLYSDMLAIAHELPTSTENVSAFIVKHINDSPNTIGWYLLKDSLVSIEHIDAKVRRVKPEEIIEAKKKRKKFKNNVSGKNHVNNYGLSAAGINSKRSNMPFDEWVRKNPQLYWTIPNYIDWAIDACNKGIFSKVGLDKSYIPNFKKRIAERSPKEKPIILDISKFKDK